MPSTNTTAAAAASSLFRRCSTNISHTRHRPSSNPMPPSWAASSSCCSRCAQQSHGGRVARGCCSTAVSAPLAQPPTSHHISDFLSDYSLPLHPPPPEDNHADDDIWSAIRHDAEQDGDDEPVLAPFYRSSVLSQPSLESALAFLLAGKLASSSGTGIPTDVLAGVLLSSFSSDPSIGHAIREDLRAARDRDPACMRMVHCFLYYKGFHALQTHRAAHSLWRSVRPRRALALFLQSRAAEVFAVDIHPGAKVGAGILLDHATGVVIGETAVVGDFVSILHGVTLGGTGKEVGDRHPKIGDGVLVGAGTQILGSVRVGEGAKVGAGSVVLKDIPPRTTAVGNPARLIGGKDNPVRLDRVPSFTMDHTSWSDYVI